MGACIRCAGPDCTVAPGRCPPMKRNPVELLSERQRQCLRLLYANHEAKEIGQALGLSPYTVHEHLRSARRLLRVARSIQAARILAEHEGANRVVSEAIGVGAESGSDDIGDATQPAPPETIVRKIRYNLFVLQRVGVIIMIAAGAIAFVGALFVGVYAITHIFQADRVDISDPHYPR
ncbi:MAG: hypothetical protein JWR80_6851 [Bradyrhizobium sp.]|nr:hypothetical protein [Bradyrhizobium sp.]